MSREEVTELGRQALGPEFASLAEQLAAATWDCPLVTVVGGKLLAEKAIEPELLERDEEFRDTVLVRFRDILVGEGCRTDSPDSVQVSPGLDRRRPTSPARQRERPWTAKQTS